MNKTISSRISFVRNNDSLEVTITQGVAKVKLALLFAWLLFWGVWGIYLFVLIQNLQADQSLLFWFSMLTIWAFFFFRILKVVLWRVEGKEKIVLDAGGLKVKRPILGLGRTKTYQLQHIKAHGRNKEKSNNLGFLSNSFWIIGGEKLGFNYMGKREVYGCQLQDKEVQALGQVMEKNLREFTRKGK